MLVGTSKAALESLVRYLGVELAGRGIRVNGVSGGVVETDALDHFENREQMLRNAREHTPAGRILQPEDLARVVAFLCTRDADMIVGQILVVDGGYGLPAMGEIYAATCTSGSSGLASRRSGKSPTCNPRSACSPSPRRASRACTTPGCSISRGRDLVAILKRAGRSALADQITDSAAALAYYTFLAIPATLLVALGVFGLVASPADVVDADGPPARHRALRGDHAPPPVADAHHQSGGGSVTAVVDRLRARAVDALGIHERADARGQLRLRAARDAWLRPPAADRPRDVRVPAARRGPRGRLPGARPGALGRRRRCARHAERDRLDLVDRRSGRSCCSGCSAAFAAVYVLAPDVEHPRFNILAPGTVLAVVVWLVASAGFSVYVATFASYNKTWGSLAAVIVLMTWLWLSSLALLLGAEVNSEAERSRELRSGLPAEDDLVGADGDRQGRPSDGRGARPQPRRSSPARCARRRWR